MSAFVFKRGKIAAPKKGVGGFVFNSLFCSRDVKCIADSPDFIAPEVDSF